MLFLFLAVAVAPATLAFEGYIDATVTRNGQEERFRYTVGTNQVRIERMETNRLYVKNLITLSSGETVLVYPHNRTFMRVRQNAPKMTSSRAGLPGQPQMPPMSPPSFPGAVPAGVGAGAGGPMLPPPMMGGEQFQATTNQQVILGLPCTRYDLRVRSQTMEIWATDQLLPFRAYMRHAQPLDANLPEERWGALLHEAGRFPLRAVLKGEIGPEMFRFEVTKITPAKIEDKDGTLFRPPAEYREIQALPF